MKNHIYGLGVEPRTYSFYLNIKKFVTDRGVSVFNRKCDAVFSLNRMFERLTKNLVNVSHEEFYDFITKSIDGKVIMYNNKYFYVIVPGITISSPAYPIYLSNAVRKVLELR